MHEQRQVITTEPENSETPLERVSSWLTPNRLFFVRNHFDVPAIDATEWRLKIEGLLEKPFEVSFEQLKSMPQRSVLATIECAGNGRSYLSPRAHGVQWGAGAIGHAEWTGVPLHLVLEKTGVDPSATTVIFEGADIGAEPDHPEPMHFARALSVEQAMHPDVLLALRTNGEPLDPLHGYPVRLFVPGHYGVASVKWLQRIEVTDQPFTGYFQTTKYTVEDPDTGERTGVGPMVVKSTIIRPRENETLGVGTNRIVGLAWAGPEEVESVEVSTDGGSSWSAADLVGPTAKYSWTLWEYLWEVASPGEHQLLCRARSASGKTQPIDHDPRRGGYMINALRPTPVSVESYRHSDEHHADPEVLLYDMYLFAEYNANLPLDVDMEFEAGAGI